MNLREGTRRLALLLGVAGAILGGFASYSELQTVREQWASHNRFERLANSDVVQEERKCRLLGYTSGCSKIKLAPGATLVKPEQNIEEDWFAKNAPKKKDAPYAATAESPEVLTKFNKDAPYEAITEPPKVHSRRVAQHAASSLALILSAALARVAA